jgi:hypothetical protein
MNRKFFGLMGAGLLLYVWAPSASAHLGLTSPVSRYGPNVLKQGPCGVLGGERSDNVTVFEPGQTILVRWEEYVNHPGHYRIAFDPDGDDDFVDPASMDEFYSNDTVLLDGIEDHAGDDPYYEVSVQLPNIECERCTLQVIQLMYDKPPYVVPGNDIYYQCADLALRCSDGSTECGDPGSPNGAAGNGGGAAGAGGTWSDEDCSGNEASALGGAGGDGGCKDSGSCSLSVGAVGTPYPWQLCVTGTLLGLAYRRRRRRAEPWTGPQGSHR